MKKVFLLLSAAMFGFAATAAEWTLENGLLSVPYNSYGSKVDGDAISDQWQGGVAAPLDNAVIDVTEESWTPAVGETFMITIKGTPSFSGKLQLFIVDEREVAGYFSKLSASNGELVVESGVEFEESFVITLDNVTMCNNGDNSGTEVEGGLIGSLVIACEPTLTSTMDGFSSSVPMTIQTSTFDIIWEAPVAIENPTALSYKGKADVETDGFKYQGQINATGISAPAGFVNVTVTGTAKTAMATLMYALIDADAAAKPKPYFSEVTGATADAAGLVAFATNIAVDQELNYSFSLPVSSAYIAGSAPAYKNVFLAQDGVKSMNQYISNLAVVTTTSTTNQFAAPSVAVEEVAASAFAVENGVVASAGEIVVYNVAGQVVATASKNFEVKSLGAGVYFITAQEGTIKFVK